MEFNETISFTGGINTDDTPQGFPKGDYRDFSYCRLGYNSGNGFAVETSLGTIEINNPSIEFQDQVVGATIWLKKRAIVYFVYRPVGADSICVYYIDSKTHETVISTEQFNFSPDWPVYHANVVDDLLKWTDGRWDPEMYDADGVRLFNPPFQINLQKALDVYYTSIDLQAIDAIKWPLEPPISEFTTDITRNDNKLRKKLFKFIVQPIYENGEIGVWSMYSNLALPTQSELVTGTNFIGLNNDNCVTVSFNTGPKVVRKFNLAVQEFDQTTGGAITPFGVFLELDKTVDGMPDNFYWTVKFYGNVATKGAIDALKNYDRLPITSDCQEYLPTNQLVYANFRESYDKIELDVGMDYTLSEIKWNPFGAIDFDITYAFGSSFIKTDATDFNAITTFPFSAGTVFWGPAPTSVPLGQMTYQLSQSVINSALASGPNPMDWNIYIMQAICDNFMDQLGYAYGVAAPTGASVTYSFTAGANIDGIADPRVRTTRQTLPTPSLKVGATHQFGIVYGDRAYRDGTVLTQNTMSVFVPWFYDINRTGLSNPQNPFTVGARLTINHQPPVWADKYWIVAKPATEILSFGQYTVTSAADANGNNYNSAITLESASNNRYRMQIDNYYTSQNKGASINHQIQVGDRVRFIRQRPEGVQTDATTFEYIPYLELEVLEYNPVGGTADTARPNRQEIYVTLFNEGSIEDDFNMSNGNLFGQLIEIYTPRPATDDNNGLFVSEWKDITPALPIDNAHTEDRSHGIVYDSYTIHYAYNAEAESWYKYTWGDTSELAGTTWDYQQLNVYNTIVSQGTVNIINANYSPDQNITLLSTSLPSTGGSDSLRILLTQNQVQEYTGGSQVQPAQLNLQYGDVYIKQRNYGTGLISESAVYYYWIEDPHYSDYWLSDIHQLGRFRLEDPNAKMVDRQAVAIHSAAYVFGTEINGLSNFSLSNDNIQELNPIYGKIVRIYNSGREGKTLKCIQEKKENSIYIQYYPNEVGSDSTVRVSGKTFSSWFDYRSLYGCTNAGATAILPSGTAMYFDNNAGMFIYSSANGQIVVSEIDPETGKDYKFRAKTKELAAKYNADDSAIVSTYVNEVMGEVGFAFRFGTQYTGTAFGGFNPPSQPTEAFIILGDHTNLYGYDMVITFPESGNSYQGNVGVATYLEFYDFTLITLTGVTPDVADYQKPGTYYTTSGFEYDHVVFDYVNMRWRSTYDYNFKLFCNFGQTLVGWGTNSQLYLHNQDNSFEFHGQPFTQKVTFVSNDQPLLLKRYQDIAFVSDYPFSVTAYSEPNRSYPIGMRTTMPVAIQNNYEGYSKVYYRKNLYDPRFYSNGSTTTSSYDPPTQPVNGWIIPKDQTSNIDALITIIQVDGSIFTGKMLTVSYDDILDESLVTLDGQAPSSNGVTGFWYYSDIAMLNGEDVRANALTHTVEYVPVDSGSLLFTVGIKGVLS